MNRNKSGIIHFLPLILITGVIIALVVGIIYFNQNSETPLITQSSPSPQTENIDINPTEVPGETLEISIDSIKQEEITIFEYESEEFKNCKNSEGSELSGSPPVCVKENGEIVFNELSKELQNWTTYKSENLGLKFDFPEYNPTKQKSSIEETEDTINISFVESGMTFQILRNYNLLSWYSDNRDEDYTELQSVMINGYSGKTFTIKSDRADTTVYLIDRDGDLLIIHVGMNKELSDQILSTFEFTK